MLNLSAFVSPYIFRCLFTYHTVNEQINLASTSVNASSGQPMLLTLFICFFRDLFFVFL